MILVMIYDQGVFYPNHKVYKKIALIDMGYFVMFTKIQIHGF